VQNAQVCGYCWPENYRQRHENTTMTINPTAQSPKETSHANRSKWLLRLLYLLMGAWVVIVFAFNIFQPIKVLPRVSLSPGFSFINQAGERKTSEDYRGKLTIYNFTYSHCDTACTQATAQMESLRTALIQLGAQEAKFSLVTISLDPERDTPAVLNTYMSPFLTAPQNDISWDFLTGDPTRTKYVVGGGFGLYYENVPGESGQYAIKFEPRFELVDGWGIVRSEYRGAKLDLALILRDINYLLAEIHNSQGVGRYAYEAAHLFRCYP